MRSESATGLRKILETTNEHLRALRELGQPVNHWDAHLIFWLSAKMDQESRKQWQLAHPGTYIKTWDDLSKFLDTRCCALETGSLKVGPPENAKAQSSEKRAQVYHMSAACSEICGDPHKLHACPEFKKKSVSDRLQFVRCKNLCFNCLQGGHTVGECQSQHTCRECKLKHHSLLHRERMPPPQAENGSMNTNPSSSDQRKCPDSETPTAASAVITGLNIAGNVPKPCYDSGQKQGREAS